MTKTFEARARKYLNECNFDESKDYDVGYQKGVMFFARHLDQEAQEKPVYTAGLSGDVTKPPESTITYSKPQQPEEIEILEWVSVEPMTQAIIDKINELTRTLNRLTHKD